MKLFEDSKMEMAYLKMGLYGEAGTGKSYTSSKVAIGLYKLIKAKKPVFFFDSETGSDFLIPMFKKEGVKLKTAKSRAFKDLLQAVDEAEQEASVLIIDSITHCWNEMLSAYQEKHNISRITLRHWIPLKQTWREFTNRYVNSHLHIIMCGRAGAIWDDVEDEEGVKELKKVGTKMKAEVETSYEPSILIELERLSQSAKAGSRWIHRAWVVKDRFDIINGKHFDNPGFESFLPHIEMLNIGGKHKAIEPNRDSKALFNNDRSGAAMFKKRDILVEEIKGAIKALYPNRNAEDEKSRLELMKKIFGTRSWKKIESMQNEDLENGLKSLEKEKPKKEEEKKK